eukprot:1057528-Pelagomonas_calceolata.AAC.1
MQGVHASGVLCVVSCKECVCLLHIISGCTRFRSSFPELENPGTLLRICADAWAAQGHGELLFHVHPVKQEGPVLAAFNESMRTLKLGTQGQPFPSRSSCHT